MSDTPKEKRKNGRPSKYKPEFCRLLIEHCKEGMPFETFAADIGVSIDTIHEWCKQHEEFSEAKKIAYVSSMRWWLQLCRAGSAGKVKGFNASMAIFTLKNRFGWKDVQEVHEHSTQTLEILIDGQRTESYAL